MYLNPSKELSMGLWAEEHSAQLAQKENRRLQDLFIQVKEMYYQLQLHLKWVLTFEV